MEAGKDGVSRRKKWLEVIRASRVVDDEYKCIVDPTREG